jgi:CBS domain-containing protein
MIVAQILRHKGSEVACTRPSTLVWRAIREMVDRDIGALVVRTDDLPLGVFTERDYVQMTAVLGTAVLDRTVGDVMRTNVPWIRPEATLPECMNIMTVRAVRHLPVIDQLELVGIVSQGDVVSALLSEHQFEIDQLHEYIGRLR